MVETNAKEQIYAPVAADLDAVIALISGVSEGYDTEHPPEVEARLAQVLSTHGKRIRPAMTLLASRLWGRTPDDRTIKMATAVELLHIASLIHDDTVDSADIRRGHATASNLWGGEVAVLLGDFVFATSATFVCDTDSVRLIRRFAHTIAELSRGELNEIIGAWSLETTRDIYLTRIYDKTASLFTTSAESGAILGEGDEAGVRSLRDFGYDIGMAYQVLDDLLDFEATDEQIGKPAGNDLSNGVLTLPAIIALESGHAKEEIAEYFDSRDDRDPDLLKRAYAAICDTDALAEARVVANAYVKSANDRLSSLPPTPARDSLIALSGYISNRRS